MIMRVVASIALTLGALVWGAPVARAQFVAGDFTFQFADPVTGNPISTLSIPTNGATAKVAVYLIQTGHTSSNLINGFGMENLGVRLNYGGTAQGVVQVTNLANSGANQGIVANVDFDVISKYGVSASDPTITATAAVSAGLESLQDPLPFPDSQDPLGNPLRILIATFTLQAKGTGALTTVPVTAVLPFAGATNNLSGPMPQIIGMNNQGGTGPLPGNGFQGELAIEPLLATATIPTLLVTAPAAVPEPSTMALGTLAAIGLAAWRRRRSAPALAA
jgi:PEP-CTERM motif